MQRLAAPGFPAGAIAAGGNRFELFQSFQPATTGLHKAAEEIAHQGVHRGVLPQRRFPSPLQQVVINGKREVGHELKVHGSRGARAALKALPGESGGVVSSVREFTDGRSQRGQGAAMALAAGRQEHNRRA